MGRKIPGRKHHGVRDPEKQRAQRLELKKVNAPPSHADDQPVPKSVQRIAYLMNKTKNPTNIRKTIDKKKNKLKKKKKLIVIETKVGEKEKTVPKFEQKKGESDKAFLHRCNVICGKVIHETDFEAKFGVAVKRNEKTGAIEETVKLKDADPIKKIMKEVKKEAKKKPKKKKAGEVEIKLTKAEKRKMKLKLKKEKKEKMIDDFERTDKVKFGEVYHAPPELSLPRNVEKTNEAARPGRKNLLLKAIINGEEPKKQEKQAGLKSLNGMKKVTMKTINKKGKRKDLPSVVRRQLEQHQKEIIEAYKTLKAKKRKNEN